jgi:glycosyltransferase involved in cell wall biosynthesis
LKFSICIPAYKNVQFLKRLLDSIAVQTFTDYEVVVTDDSPGEDVMQLCQQYNNKFLLRYFKNPQNLNTPENWNESIRHAQGDWIKLIHDDDWFSNSDSLKQFADAINENNRCNFFFSAYTNIYEGTSKKKHMFLKPFWKKALAKNPNILIADNVVGPPSVVLHKNDKKIWYDSNMKYIVDIDFYIRYLQTASFCYINQPLVNVGINSAQVTKYTFGVAEVHLKEALLLLEKTGTAQLKNVLVFDGWWRLIRNFKIRNEEQIHTIGYKEKVPSLILHMMRIQKHLPYRLLKTGVFSKAMMVASYSYLRGKGVIS